MKRLIVRCFPVLAGLFILLIVGCSSSSTSVGGSSGGTPPVPDFTLSLSPGSLNLTAGSSVTLQISLTPLNGFTGTASVQLTGLPATISTTPASPFTVSASTPQTLTLTSAAATPAGSYTLQLAASSGSLSHTQAASLMVQAPPAPPDFSLTLTPASQALISGSQASFQVAVQPANGFSGAVQILLSGLPAETSITPAGAFTLGPSGAQTITVATAATYTGGSFTLTVAGSSGSLSHSAPEQLTLKQAPSGITRADFVRTDDTPLAAAYDRLHQTVYVSNPIAGTVDILSSITYQILRRIPVPLPGGIDISPDFSTVFIGTGTQAVYALDTASMSMTARYFTPLDQLSPSLSNLQTPYVPVATQDGKVLISEDKQIVKWDPVANTVTTVLQNPAAGFQTGAALPEAHSLDHSKVIISNNYNASTVNVYDTVLNQFLPALTFQGYAYSVAVNPTGTQYAISIRLNKFGGESFLFFLDANLNIITSFPGGGGLLYSADGSTLYAVGNYGTVPAILLYDTSTFQMVGTASSYTSSEANRLPALQQEWPLVADETGRIFGSADHGVSIDDTLDLRPYQGTEMVQTNDFSTVPSAGPVGQQQTVQVLTASYPSAPAIYFGPLQSSATSIASAYLSTIAPGLSQTGPVNIRLDGPEQVLSWMPQAYTYGAVLTNGWDLAGSTTAASTLHLYGYGLSTLSDANSAPSLATTATIGGASATVASAGFYSRPYPFPLGDFTVQTPTLPPGPADITVSTPWGEATRHNSFHALSIQAYALGGTPYGIAYDSYRKQVYVSEASHIDVFSLGSKAFLAPIQVPTLNQATELGGLTLTPDGTTLVAGNWLDGSVALINPDSPSTAVAVAVGIPPSSSGGGGGPNQVAATNSGTVLVTDGFGPAAITYPSPQLRAAPHSTAASPQSSVWSVDLTSKTATPFTGYSFMPTESPYLAGSPDGSQICFTGQYTPLVLYAPQSGTALAGPGLASGQTCAVNGSVVVEGAGGRLTASDLQMRRFSYTSLLDYQSTDLSIAAQANHGAAVDPTGALLYLPYPGNIVLFDAHTGETRENIALPHLMFDLFNGAIALDETGTQIFYTSSQGLTVLQMDTLPLAVGSVTSSGSTWTIAGTGFSSATLLTVDGTAVATQLVDGEHLQASSAPSLSAAHQITLSNPDGHTYTYDAAYFR